MNRKLRTAVIGLGQQGKKRLQAILDPSSGFELVYIADKEKKVLRDVAGQFSLSTISPSAKPCTAPEVNESMDWMDAVESPDVEVVIIATTTDHESIAIECLKKGKHILVEKPLGPNLESSKRIVESHNLYKQDYPKLIAKVGFNYPYRPSARAAFALQRAGLIGEVIHARATFGHAQFVDATGDRTRDFLTHSSSLEDLGIHVIDLGLALMKDNMGFATGLVTTKQVFKEEMVFKASDGVEKRKYVAEVELGTFTTVNNRVLTVSSSFVEHRPWMGLRCELLGTRGRLVFSMAPNALEIMIKHEHDEIDAVANESIEERFTRIEPIANATCVEHRMQIDSVVESIGVSPKDVHVPEKPPYRKDPALFYTEYHLDFGNVDPSIGEELKEFAAKIRGEAVSDSYRDATDCVAAQALIEAARRSALSEPPGMPIDVATLELVKSVAAEPVSHSQPKQLPK